MIALYLCALLVVLLVLAEAYDRTQPKYVAARKLPGPGIHCPIIGNAYVVTRFNYTTGFASMQELRQQFPNGYYFYYYRTLIYNIYTAEAFEDLMLLTNTKKGQFYQFMSYFIGDGLLTSHSVKWLERRKMITPAFHFKILKHFFQTFSSHSDNLVNELKPRLNERVNVQNMFEEFSLNLICETSMGAKEINASAYHKSLIRLGELLSERFFSYWAHPTTLYHLLGYARKMTDCVNVMHEFTAKLIAMRRQTFELGQHKKCISDDIEDGVIGYKNNQTALLDTLLAAQIEHGTITDEGIQEEVDTFVFTGHDTIAAGMTYTMLCIAEHPHVQQKLYEEIMSVVSSDETLTTNHLTSFTYMDLVIKESMRLLPPVPWIMRELLEDTDIAGIRLPAGTQTIMYIYDLHRDKRWFPEPDKFIPERFLPEHVAKRHRFAYLPFSAGIRNCIGQKYAIMEIKTMLFKVLKAYRMEAVTKIKDLKFVVDMILHTNHPIEIKFTSRK